MGPVNTGPIIRLECVMSELLFSRRLTWVIYEIEEDDTYVIDCWGGDIITYMNVGYYAEPQFSNTLDDRLHIHFINPDNGKHYYADLIESRFADKFMHN